ncbi:MAG: GFA family protein [Caulobacteraceae bacterium]|nr:GFA family protein [Caulobacteraceae bacterium]
MRLEGGCYCKKVRYVAEGDPVMKAACCCRECQYITGGAPNLFIAMPKDGFAYVEGQPKAFTRDDIPRPATREFCPDCGTHLTTRAQGFPAVIVKVGTLDEPSAFGGPDLALYTIDRQPFHDLPEGLPTFERAPGRG